MPVRSALLGLVLLLPQAPAPQGAPPQPVATSGRGQEPLDPTTTAALDRLAGLLQQRRAELAAATAAGDTARAARLTAEVQDLAWQFAGLASRLDVQEFEAPTARSFDLQQEVEQLIKPLVQALKDATEEPRQVTDIKGRIELLQQRQATAEQALRQVQLTRDRLPSPSLARAEAERELTDRWRPTVESLRGEVLVLQARLLALQENRASLLDRVTEVTRKFVQDSGLSLLLCIAVFTGVWSGLRWLQNRLLSGRSPERGFSLRLLEVVCTVLGLALAVVATLVVPYVRNDWLLLAVGLVFLLGVGWVLVRALPQFFEQIRLVLNVGAVREGERLELDGLPWRVDQLRFYSRLVNPDLDGGVLRVPIHELIGKRSRRAGSSEPWFPCRQGDHVLLRDGTFGKVLQQTPSAVQLDQYGTPRTIPAAAFLQAEPRNLSQGFGVETTFGIDYRHQADALLRVPRLLTDAVRDELATRCPDHPPQRLEVQFEAAGTSSLDYRVFATFDGAAAARYPELRRALQHACLAACQRHDLVVPFPQLVVHRAPAG